MNNTLIVKFLRLRPDADSDIPLPCYMTPRSVGMDIYAAVENIVELAPGRVILNPGAESRALERALKDAGTPYEHACTLVLLRTGQF